MNEIGTLRLSDLHLPEIVLVFLLPKILPLVEY